MPLTIARGKRPSPAGAAEKGQRMPLESLLISFAISSGHVPDGSFRRMAVRITLRCEGGSNLPRGFRGPSAQPDRATVSPRGQGLRNLFPG
jgi:hypothetical protein